ncbi:MULTISPECIES: hypothetical protein [Sphingobacterium]|uniref:hypothetical protein n=1 Tax=Sphingobacterium TaxID=28453 RepID=UPI001047A34E|nr:MULTISPECIES: hypothetical protein [Sphingobacterium]MCW2263745.1 hypothetical protein [Sphingobacterium kitahiroshimense]TCR00624.1 hypothetical protein EDF67_1162 [Sphingobacterium sp. JUb78]
MNFYLDPAVLTLDKENTTKDQLEEFIYSLIDYKKTMDLNWGAFYIPDSTSTLLFENNLYPLVDNIKHLTKTYNIDYIQPEEIDKIICSILNKTMSYENHLTIYDVLYEDVHNEESKTDNGISDFTQVLKTMTLCIILSAEANKKELDNNIILSNVNLICLDVNISLCESIIDYEPPSSLKTNVQTYLNFNNFVTTYNPAALWTNITNEKCFRIALAMQLKQTDTNIDFYEYTNSTEMLIMKSFLDSQKALNFQNEKSKAQMLLRSLTEEILKTHMAHTHEIRESKGGNSKQLKWKEYYAWRRDIDHEFHLHYWKKGQTKIFTDVVHHNNFNISKFKDN